MSLTVTSHELADVELAEAAKYYDSEVPGLGQVFLTEFEHGISQILAYPEGAPIILGVVRRRLLRRFPYGIIYSLHEERLFILAVANQHRRPFYWRGRLESGDIAAA